MKVRISGTPKKRVRITGIGTQGPSATPNATMMAMGGSNYVPGTPTGSSYANKGATRGYGMQQQGSGMALDRFWSSPAGYPGATSQVQPFVKVGTTLPESKTGGDINAEKNERVLGDFDQDGSLELMNVGGPSHAEGGKNVDVPSHSFVFSDTKDLKIKDPKVLAMFGITSMKRGGYTPASMAAKYDLNKYKAATSNPQADHYATETAQIMSDNYTAKLSKLAQIQEEMKRHMGMKHSAGHKYGGPAPVFDKGGNVANLAANGAVSQMVNPVYDMYATEHPAMDVPYSQGNKVMGIPHDEAMQMLNGKDRVPYTPEIGARIGYHGEYGHNVQGLQRWEQEQAPGYGVNGVNYTGTNYDGVLGVRTLSPPMYRGMNPWDTTHDTPAMPAMNMTPGQIGSQGPVSTPDQNPYTAPSGDSSSLEKETSGNKRNRWNFAVDPNFYGNLQNAMQIGNLRKFQPYEPVPQAVIPDTVFMDPTRAIAAQQEEARSASEADSMSANPQASRAMSLARQGIAGKQAADTIGQYHNQNVGIANAAAQGAAQITNQLFERQANRLAELNKANFLSDRDYQREMSRLQSENVDRYQKQHDTQVKTAWLNKTSPYFDINPVTQMPLFKSEAAKAKFDQMYAGNGSGGSGALSPEKEDAASKYAAQLIQKYPGLPVADAAKWARQEYGLMSRESETYKPGAMMPSMRYTGMAMGAGMPNTYGMGMYGSGMKIGGQVPKYAVGGDFLPLAPGADMPAGDHESYQPQQPQPQQQMSDRKMSKADIATVTKNPGDMKYASWMSKVGGYPSGIPGKDGGEFAAFPDFNSGMNAYKEQLFGDTDGVFKSNYYKPHTTVDQALKTWSNNGYGGDIYPEVKNKTLAQLTPQERDELIKRQIKAESGSTYKLLKQQGVLEMGGMVKVDSPLQNLKKFLK